MTNRLAKLTKYMAFFADIGDTLGCYGGNGAAGAPRGIRSVSHVPTASRPGGPGGSAGFDHRGTGNREGAGREPSSLSVEAVERPAGRPQLLRPSPGSYRDRALRSRGGGVHRRHGTPEGAFRGGQRGHAVSRRDRAHTVVDFEPLVHLLRVVGSRSPNLDP